MKVRRIFAVVSVVAAVFLSTGCGGNGNAPTPDETSDPLYQQAQDLKKQGRNNEALNAFLKVIDRRGETGAPESHLEAGALYRTWAKDPFEAYHHFRKYLELQPNGPRAEMVRGQLDAAKREVARILQAPPGDQSMRIGQNEETEQLRRRVQDLEAELSTLRGSAPVTTMHSAPPLIPLPDDARGAAVANNASNESVITPVQTPPADGSPFARPLITPASSPPRASPPAQANPSTPERVATNPTRPSAPQRTAAPAAGRRSHTVTSGEKSLWGIARQYYGKPSAAQVQGIFQANRDVMKSDSDLRPGMVLRIP